MIAYRIRSGRGAIPRLLVLAGLLACSSTELHAQRNETFHEMMANNDGVVVVDRGMPEIAEPLGKPPESALLVVSHVLSGGEPNAVGTSIRFPIKRLNEANSTFLILGNRSSEDSAVIKWERPIGVSSQVVDYLLAVPREFDSVADRLGYFWQALEDSDDLIANNAHLEFALASNEEVAAASASYSRETLLEWISNPSISGGRIRLYYALLAMKGLPSDAERIEELILSPDHSLNDAMLACYLTLRGEAGADFIEKSIIKNETLVYADVYHSIVAFRYLAAVPDSPISRERIIQAFRGILTFPELADLVISDLADLNDWQSAERIAELFARTGDPNWNRVPAVNFMRLCPLPEAGDYLREFERIDPSSVRRALVFFPDPDPDEEKPAKPPAIRPMGRPSQGIGCVF